MGGVPTIRMEGNDYAKEPSQLRLDTFGLVTQCTCTGPLESGMFAYCISCECYAFASYQVCLGMEALLNQEQLKY